MRIGLTGNPRTTVLSWPVEAGCYVLEATDQLGNPTWTTDFTHQSVVLTNGCQQVTVDSTSRLRFFRLKKP